MMINNPNTPNDNKKCSATCWYEIVFPVIVFGIVFVFLVVFCKCSIEIFRKWCRRSNSTRHRNEITLEDGVSNTRYRNTEDLPPSYSTLQLSLPRSETFPADCFGVDLHADLQRESTSNSCVLPTYDDIMKQKYFQDQQITPFVAVINLQESTENHREVSTFPDTDGVIFHL